MTGECRMCLSERVERLFTTLPKSDRTAHTSASIASDISATCGDTVTADFIDGIRSGAVTDVPDQILCHIAGAFGFDAAYLIDDDCSDLDQQLRLFGELRSAGVPWVALRRTPGPASPAERDQVMSLLRSINEHRAHTSGCERRSS